MSIETDLPIHATGSKLLSLAVRMQVQMPRTVKRMLGEQVKELCIEMLSEMARANGSMRAEHRVPHIVHLLEIQRTLQILLRICLNDRYVSVDLWGQATVLLESIGKQGGGWLKKTRTKTAGAPAA